MDEKIEWLLLQFKETGFHTLRSGYNFEAPEEHTLYRNALIYLEDEGIIENLQNSRYRITSIGLDILNSGNWKQYKKSKAAKEALEDEKSRIDLELAKRTLKEFPKTRRRANIAIGVSIFLAILKLLEWSLSLLPK